MFRIKKVKPKRIQVLKNVHLKFYIDGHAAVWWNAKKHIHILNSGKLIDVAAKIEINRWQQRSSVQYVVEDIRYSEG